MGCGCGGASNVWKPPADGQVKAAPASGLPKVWNGPAPKTDAK